MHVRKKRLPNEITFACYLGMHLVILESLPHNQPVLLKKLFIHRWQAWYDLDFIDMHVFILIEGMIYWLFRISECLVTFKYRRREFLSSGVL